MLTKREQNIVLAAVNLWKIDADLHYIPDYNLYDSPELDVEEMREVRDLVQEMRKAT